MKQSEEKKKQKLDHKRIVTEARMFETFLMKIETDHTVTVVKKKFFKEILVSNRFPSKMSSFVCADTRVGNSSFFSPFFCRW